MKNLIIYLILVIFLFSGCTQSSQTISPTLSSTISSSISQPQNTDPPVDIEFTALERMGRFPHIDQVVSIGDQLFYKGTVKVTGDAGIDDYPFKGLYMKSMDNQSKRVLLYDDFLGGINQYKGKLYFINGDNELIMLDPHTKQSEVLLESLLDALIIGDELIYVKFVSANDCQMISKNLITGNEAMMAEHFYFNKQLRLTPKSDKELLVYCVFNDDNNEIPCIWDEQNGLRPFDTSSYEDLKSILYFFEDGRMLGSCSDGIYLYTGNGSDREMVISINPDNQEQLTSWFVLGDYIFYSKMKKSVISNYRYSIRHKSEKFFYQMDSSIMYTTGNILLEGPSYISGPIYMYNALTGERKLFDPDTHFD